MPTGFNTVKWSTAGDRIAFVGQAAAGAADWGLHVYTADGTLLNSTEVPWRVWDIQWSSDDRYIVMLGTDNEGSHGVIFYDMHTDTLSVVDDFQDWVQWSDLRAETATVDFPLPDGTALSVAFPANIDLTSNGIQTGDEATQDGPHAWSDGSMGSLLIFIDDCDRMTRLHEEVYGSVGFAFCDEPTNTLFFVNGSAEVQERIHSTLRVTP